MKIAISAKGKTLDDQVDPRFGRCSCFLIVDPETMNVEVVENPNLALGGGAGIQSAQLMAEHEVNVMLTGNCGPNASQALNAADIKVVVGVNGTVREAVENWQKGTFTTTSEPNVESHFGMKPGSIGGGRGVGGGVGGGGMGGGRGVGGGGRGVGGGMGGGGMGGGGMGGGGMGGGRGR